MPQVQTNSDAVSRERKYHVRNVVRSVVNEIWAIEQGKLEEIMELLELRSQGIVANEEELRERFGAKSQADSEDQRIILDGGIQVIDVFGTLAPRMNLMMRFSGGTSTQQLANELRTAANAKDVRSIILRVDSPGGSATYTPEVATAVRELGQSKRVVTSATNMMASAAYYIGSAASEVFASPSTNVGSIGVYAIMSNLKDYYESKGIKFNVFRAGELKAAGNPYEELTAERKDSIQARVDAIYTDFVASVAEQRRTTTGNVLETFGQGTVFLAGEAKSRGMIDGVLTFEQVVAAERQRLSSTTSVVFGVRQEDHSMNPRIKALLFARDLISSAEADEATCQTALTTFCKVAGVDVQQGDEQLIKALLGFNSNPKPDVATVGTQTVLDPVVRTQEPEPATQGPTAAEERERVLELQARGEILGISSEDINSAIEQGTTIEAALRQWTDQLSAQRTPVITGGDSQIDKASRGASAVLLSRYQSLAPQAITEEDTRDANGYGASLQHASVLEMARTQLRSSGYRVTGDPTRDARAYLQSADIFQMAAVNGRGDHPDMLSALVGKMLTQGAIIAQASYPQWCERIEDLPDFKPKNFIDVGVFNQLDAIAENKKFQEMQFQSQLQTWIRAERFGNKVGLTPEMVVDDDLGGFARQLRSLGNASRNTVNQAVLTLLNLNPTMLDGNAFFSAAHSNLISAGSGAPSSTQLVTHRTNHRLQMSYGSTQPMGLAIEGILAPATLEEDVLQTVVPNYEVKTPNTDANVNTFRGQVRPVIDAHLDAHSTSIWYTFVNPMLAAAVVYAFQTGYGEQGQRDDWYDPDDKCRYVSIETRFGVALANYRGMVRNNG